MAARPNDNEWMPFNAVMNLIPDVLAVVLEWSCPKKSQDETFYEFLNKSKKITTTALKKHHRLREDDVKALQNYKDASQFDVTRLYQIICLLCDDIDKTLLDAITKAKDFRNDVCHKTERATSNSQLYADILDTLKFILREAG